MMARVRGMLWGSCVGRGMGMKWENSVIERGFGIVDRERGVGKLE